MIKLKTKIKLIMNGKKYLYYGLKTLYLKNPNTFPAG